jgi:hypothetical protein
MTRRSLLAAGMGLSAGAAWAGQKPVGGKAPGSIFNQVITAPTGRNGYEELVAAADELRSSLLFKEADEAAGTPGGLTLAMRRRVLQDPALIRCLALVRRGLSKPITSPRQELKISTALPELPSFRQIARLLVMQQYVFYAEGRSSDAIETTRVCLRLSQVIQMDTLIHGLVGVSMTAIGVRGTGDHLGQLAARDCAHLYEVCMEWLAEADPLPAMVATERQNLQEAIDELKTGDVELIKASLDLKQANPDPETRQLTLEIERAANSPASLSLALEEAGRRVDTYYESILPETVKPPWERRFEALPQGGDLTTQLAAHLATRPQQISDKYAGAQAQVRLLALHAAILAYRWEHDRAPESLAVLNPGDLALDPFTGELLEYQVFGRRYRLASVGPEIDANDPRAVNGRLPVSVAGE